MSTIAISPVAGAKPLSFMEELDPLVFVHRAQEASSSHSSGTGPHQPRLIIIASWTDARGSHIAKYIVKYQLLYPTTHNLLLKSTTKHNLRPSPIGASMKHAAAVVRAIFPTAISSPSPELLLHIFPNGGSSSVANLYQQYALIGDPVSDKNFPPHVTVLDSRLGVYSISRAIAFIRVGLSPFQNRIATPILYAWAIVWSIRRVYIYSHVDALIDSSAIEAHAADAQAKGYSVTLEKYENSAHVALVRTDESRYWKIVRQVMEDSEMGDGN
ncbi:hypothetical protein GGR57DRAFT_494229 [Xylariaceae sp. FL1272]|nr:hypothetical protein GGR57DRAFT_494229 [Xylariaceae sp. FL1272]